MSEVLNASNQELTNLNSHFLMVAQKQLLQDPISAKHKLGMDDSVANFIDKLSVTDMQKLAESGVCTVQFRFNKASIPHLANYISGDNLAITQAVLGAR